MNQDEINKRVCKLAERARKLGKIGKPGTGVVQKAPPRHYIDYKALAAGEGRT